MCSFKLVGSFGLLLVMDETARPTAVNCKRELPAYLSAAFRAVKPRGLNSLTFGLHSIQNHVQVGLSTTCLIFVPALHSVYKYCEGLLNILLDF